jgi:hypothetical protein
MKYIVDLPSGGWDLGNYFLHLNNAKEKLPAEVFSFASDTRNYDLESHQSLHDAWLENLKITEPASGDRSEIRTIEIECRFLGPYHDLFINLKYSGVSSFSFLTPEVTGEEKFSTVGHGDLLMHEITMNQNQMNHELIFSRGSIFKIAFANLRHWID